MNIYLPKCEYSEEELYYILLHECTHFANGDLYIKWLTQICRCLCWWNPLVYKMQDMLEKNLEIRCDLTVTETEKSSRGVGDFGKSAGKLDTETPRV